MTERKGIILAGGSGTRLNPITHGISKQLLPIYDKPMIYYPLSVLMLSGIREICIICTPHNIGQFEVLLGDGRKWGLSFSFIEQASPDGLAQAYILAEEFLQGSPSAMVLGDNIFHGSGFSSLLKRADEKISGGTIFGYEVANPSDYGVASFDNNGQVSKIEEKPAKPRSNYAVTGLYFLDGTAASRAKQLKPSDRGELEITSLLGMYLDEGLLSLEYLPRGHAWLDMGTHASLLDAGNYVRTLQVRQGIQVACPEEIAFQNGWINVADLIEIGEKLSNTDYGKYLMKIANGKSLKET